MEEQANKKIDHLFVRASAKPESIERISQKTYSFWRSVFQEFFRKPSAIISLIAVGIVVFFAIFGPMIRPLHFTGKSPYEYNLTPSPMHWFGTDQQGRDIWTQVWSGLRTSLQIALLVSFINVFFGILIGSVWGYFKKVDQIMIELRNFINNIPDLLIIVLLMTLMSRSYWTMIFALTIFGWLPLASYIRNHIIVIANTEFNIASRTLGTKSFKMIIHNILPFLLSVIVTFVVNIIPSAIGTEVGLSYLGLGIPFTGKSTSLGIVLQTGFTSDLLAYPHILFFPALILAILTLSFFRMGIALGDACNPKNHR